MKRYLAIILLAMILLIGISSATSGYISQYPPAYNFTYANATSTHSSSFNAYFALDPTKSLVGANTAGSWHSNTSAAGVNQRFNIDLGSSKIINRIYYENHHHIGTLTNRSVKNFTFWGSNTAASFANVSYANNTGWTQITANATRFEEHVAANTTDPRYITLTNNIQYRYYSFKFDNNWGDANYIALRRLELQTAVNWLYTTPGTYEWECPSDVYNITVLITGAGGSGMAAWSGGGTSYGSGYGGKAGQHTALTRIAVVPGTNYTVVVGEGGSSVEYMAAAGEDGGLSSAFGYTMAGGAGGARKTNVDGGNGENGVWNITKFAGDGWKSSIYTNGTGGVGYGAGGGGSTINATTPYLSTSGWGANGSVLIYQYGEVGLNVAGFSAEKTAGIPGTAIRFIDESLIANETSLVYEWDFGDDSTSSVTGNVTHVYEYYGTYDVSLTITNTGSSESTSETKVGYITISSAPPVIGYVPNQVRFTVLDYLGNNVVGATVNATYVASTMPSAIDWMESAYYVNPDVAADMLNSNLAMIGTTGGDGAIVYTMHSSLQYNITVTNGSTVLSMLLYPKENDYNIWLPKPAVENLYEQINATLNITEPNTSYFTMRAQYQDHAAKTSSLLFYVNYTNGTPVYSTTVAPGSSVATPNTTVLNVRGTAYYYGLRATRTDGNISLDQGVTGKGPNGVLVDLRLPNVIYYQWIALFILFLVTSLSSKVNIRFMAILMPVMAAFFWWFGWMSGSYLAAMIPFACLLGAIYYMKGSLRENFGVGGAGSLLLNIVVFLIIFQSMIGFVSELGVFNQTAQMQPTNEFTNLETTSIREGVQNFGGINDPIQSANSFASIGWATIKIALNMIGAIFIIGRYLTEMFPYVPPGFFAIIQIGIWALYIFFILKLIGKSGTESDF